MISDSIMNYHTIASLAYEDEYLEKFGIKSSANQFNVGLFNLTQNILLLKMQP